MKKRLPTIVLVLVMLVGISLILYPTVSNYWNSLHQSRAIADYASAAAKLDTAAYEQMLAEAHLYNESLLEKGDRFHPSDEEYREYLDLLSVTEQGLIGYIEIPSIKQALAIYHGYGEAVLQIAVGHIAGSSLPVGGESTHSILTAHRGLPSAKLFTNLDKLVLGDIFMIQVLDETLTYEVDQILIVEPHEVEGLVIEKGKDLCTLVTCTPYAINTHRLLVRGHRIENLEESVSIRVTADAMQVDPLLVALLVAVPLLFILMILTLWRHRKGRP